MSPRLSLLQIRDLRIALGRDNPQVVVSDVGFDINAGEKLALVGESGSGKSVTAFSILKLHEARLCDYRRGVILFNGEDLLWADESRMRQLRGKDIGMIFQEPMTALNPLHTIGQQLLEPIKLHQGLEGKKAEREAIYWLQRVGIDQVEERLRSYPHQLSGGQRQRVMIAMALCCRPRLLIADEPTTALDVTIQQQILDLLQELQQEEGMAILLITHDLNMVRHFADRVCVMEQGRVVEEGRVEAIFSDPQHSYTQRLLASEPERLIDDSAKMSGEELLKASEIRCHFPIRRGFFKRQVGVVKAVDNVKITLEKAETIGIVGESGSGKTTLGMSLLRLQKSDGEIIFDQQSINQLSEGRLRPLRRRFQIVLQDPFSSLSPRMTVEQIISEGVQLHFPELTKEERHQRIVAVLQEVDLDSSILGRYPHEFSGGQRQRIAIARVVVLEPDLILLDEPTSALDISIQKQVLELLHRLQQRHGMSYLFISHDLKVIRAIAHRIVVMKSGKIVEEGKTEDIFTQPQHPYTRQLLSAALFKDYS